MSKKIIFDSDEVVNFFETNGTVTQIDDKMYLYMPFWFRKVDNNTMEWINWDRLPNELKEYIKKQHDAK